MGLDDGVAGFDVRVCEGVGGAEGKEGGAERGAGLVVHGYDGLRGEVGALGDEVDVLLSKIPFAERGTAGGVLRKGCGRGGGAASQGGLFVLFAFGFAGLPDFIVVHKGIDTAGEEVRGGYLFLGEEDLVQEFFDCFAEIVFALPQREEDVEELELREHLAEESFLVVC